LLAALRDDGGAVPVTFLSPIVVTMLAAASAMGSRIRERIRINPEAETYAVSCGLQAVLEGGYEPPVRTGRQGSTYTRLTRLQSEHEVDACNAVINDLFHERLGDNGGEFVRLLSKVVGELHDNVASHSRGVGYSSAQRYKWPRGEFIQFAIVDSGVGMLENVRRIVQDVRADEEAIEWCLKRGNTTAARESDGWEQRLPEDSVVSPYPATVRTVTSDNHHQGLGLWQLQELARVAGGSFWVGSGAGQCRCLAGDGHPTYDSASPPWQGVAIEVELPVPTGAPPDAARRAALEGLAERLGL
jgi:hypothetical protein